MAGREFDVRAENLWWAEERAADNVVRRTTSRQSIIEVRDGPLGLYVVKTATPAGEADLLAQVAMFLGLPQPVRDCYPTLLAYNVSVRPLWYAMPFYPGPSLRDILFGLLRPAASVAEIAGEVLDFDLRQQYPLRRELPSDSYFVDTYVKRMARRLAEAEALGPELNRVMSESELAVLGRTISRPTETIRRILADRALALALQPRDVGLIHGQLEFDHIVLRDEAASGRTFVLLDPRGLENTGDMAYDIGKVWQSCRSMVDLLEREQFSIEVGIVGSRLEVTRLEMGTEDIRSACLDATRVLESKLGLIADDLRDPHLLMRSSFAEAVHLCSAVPFYHAGAQPAQRAVACYVLGAAALAEFESLHGPAGVWTSVSPSSHHSGETRKRIGGDDV